MPFVDFVNHDFRARPYRLARDEGAAERTLSTFADRPVDGSAECFTRYNVIDALDSYLNYGFLDRSAGFVSSVPVTLELPEGLRIDVRGEGGAPFKGALPEDLRDLWLFMPQIRSREADRLAVQRLLLPGGHAPRALRRVLGALLRLLRPEAANALVRDAIVEAERQLLAANRAYYRDLAEAAAAADRQGPDGPAPPGRAAALAAVKTLAESQTGRIDAYAERTAVPA